MNKKKSISLLFLIFLLFFNIVLSADELRTHKIEVLVNDKIITNYDVIQRMKLMAILRNNNISEENYDQFAKSSVDDLIREKLKLEKIIEYDIKINNEQYESHEIRFLKNLGSDKDELVSILDKNNINYEVFRNFLEIDILWQRLIYGLFMRVVKVPEQEIQSLIEKNPNLDESIATEILTQRQLDLKSNKLIRDIQNEATIEYK